MDKEFVLHLKSLKKKKRITNEKLSELSKIPLGTINKLLSGETEDPQLSTIAAVCGVLDASIDDIIGKRSSHGFLRRMSLSKEEAEMVSNVRHLDAHSKKLVCAVIDCELARISQNEKPAERQKAPRNQLRLIEKSQSSQLVSVPMFEFPATSETGVFLDYVSSISVRLAKKTPSKTPDIAIRLRDGGMEPQYSAGDIILVKKSAEVGVGYLGIFSVNGVGYFKVFSGDRLISLNKSHDDIPLTGSYECIGKVMGKAEL